MAPLAVALRLAALITPPVWLMPPLLATRVALELDRFPVRVSAPAEFRSIRPPE